MGLFRRRQETLNEQLLREAGLDPAQVLGDAQPVAPEPEPPPFRLTSGRSTDRDLDREWDVMVTVRAPGVSGDRLEFTTIPNGDVIVGEDSGDADLSPLADAVERHVSPPYRVVATRQGDDLWAVGAKRIEVARIDFPDGDKLALSQHGNDRELSVDDDRSDAAVPAELEQLGEAAGDSFYVEAERIDGDLWEVRVTAL